MGTPAVTGQSLSDVLRNERFHLSVSVLTPKIQTFQLVLNGTPGVHNELVWTEERHYGF